MTSTQPPEQFQISLAAAERYESAFVPGFFAQWAPTLCEVAGVAAGEAVLDVACGTGIVARTAAGLTGPAGRVVGSDLNPSMLTVAERVRPDIEWRQADAAALPFDDGEFDVVLCQMALMFMPNPEATIREMSRVVKPGGRVAIAVPSSLDDQPAFKPFVELAAQVCGPDATSLLTTYFVCGDLGDLAQLFASAGLDVTVTRAVTGTYAAPTVDAAVTTEVESTPLVERISELAYEQLRARTRELWQQWVTPDGALAAPFGCHFIAGRAG